MTRGAADAGRSRRLDAYWSVPEQDPERLRRLQAQFAEQPAVEAAVLLPAPELPGGTLTTLDLSPRQGYLDAAPNGIGARQAWPRPGGTGTGVRVIDIEGDWLGAHESLNGAVEPGLHLRADPAAPWNGAHQTFLDHGTAVLGQLAGTHPNGRGIRGICPGAEIGFVSHMHREAWTGIIGGPGAISRATDMLRPGDVLLLEMHLPGPRFGFGSASGQLGYIAVEWFEPYFDAILDATDNGILVVEAAGNGREDLDDPLYDANSLGFSSAWTNPFRRGRDCGAIIVGAGAPPGGSHGPARSRLGFSNHGACLDAQGWGAAVVTAGYGDLQRSPAGDRSYTATFGGTSSASPCVAGALALVQGMLRAAGAALLTPRRARQLLRHTGTPQPAPAHDRIGSLPDVAALFQAALQTDVSS
ncbi:MAG: S8 family serine peptidase [Acetobacteraceae bacterium]|nr:S8 family serine peptidase [Acetobacteraceae bacterium]